MGLPNFPSQAENGALYKPEGNDGHGRRCGQLILAEITRDAMAVRAAGGLPGGPD